MSQIIFIIKQKKSKWVPLGHVDTCCEETQFSDLTPAGLGLPGVRGCCFILGNHSSAYLSLGE